MVCGGFGCAASVASPVELCSVQKMIRFRRILSSPVSFRKVCSLPRVVPPAHCWISGRCFSSGKDNEGFRDLLKKLNDDDESKDGNGSSSNDPDVSEKVASNTDGDDKKDNKEDGAHDKQDDDDEKTEQTKESDDVAKDSSGGFQMPAFDTQQAIGFLHTIPGKASTLFASLKENATEGWKELRGDSKTSVIKKKVNQSDSYRRAGEKDGDDEFEEDEDGIPIKKIKKTKKAAESYDGPTAMVHVKEPTSQWETMKQRLQESPIIREFLKGSKKAYDQAAATDAGQKLGETADKVRDKLEDAREFWETSQNPIVYTVSGIWDNMTSDTEEGLCIKEILKLDPSFQKEEWCHEIRTEFAPAIIQAHLDCDLDTLSENLNEGVYNKLAQDIKIRQSDKIEFDPNILDIDESRVEMKLMDGTGPVILAIYMVQQINCIRKNGEVIEGSENAVVAKFYSLAFQQEYDEETEEVRWKVADYEFGGDTPYL